MSVLLITELNLSQKKQIQSILDASAELEPVTISFPMDDADLYALYEIDGHLRSAAAFTKEDEETFECCAFTAPDYRRQGLFAELLDSVMDELPEDTRFLFYTDHNSKDALLTLSAYKAECIMEEHMMELDAANISSLSITATDSSDHSLTMDEQFPDDTRTFVYHNSVGTVNISVFSSYYYLYGFEIQENHRGKGLGTQLLYHVLRDLYEKKPMPVRLQVSGDNLPALHLYKKTGFRITETLSCYLY